MGGEGEIYRLVRGGEIILAGAGEGGVVVGVKVEMSGGGGAGVSTIEWSAKGLLAEGEGKLGNLGVEVDEGG